LNKYINAKNDLTRTILFIFAEREREKVQQIMLSGAYPSITVLVIIFRKHSWAKM
jgi:hypothetical protein